MSFPKYPKYKDSGVEWLGEVPEHWGVACLKHATKNFYSGGTPESGNPEYWSDDEADAIPWVAIGDMTRAAVVSTTDRQVSRSGLASKDLPVLPAGTLLYSMYASLGKVAVLGIPAAINQAILGIVPDSKVTAQSFLRYWLIQVERHLELFSSSNTQANLNAAKVRSLPLLVPPLSEQSVIASFLDRETAKIDELVAEQQRLMELLKEKRQAVISHAVTKGLNPDAPMKPSGVEWLGEVPTHWEVHRLKAVSDFTTSGPRGWSERISDEGALFIQSGELDDSLGVDFASAKRVQVGVDAESTRTRLHNGDVVVCITGAKTGNVALCAVVPEPAYINQHLCLVRPRGEILPTFLGLVLKSSVGQTYFEFSQYGLKQGLSLEDVRGAPVPLPPLAEQNEIVSHLDTMNRQFEVLSDGAELAIELLTERRSALISAAVTGQIDVRHLATAEAA